MGGVFGSLLLGGGLVLFTLALVAVFRPLPKLNLPTRKVALRCLAPSLGLIVIGALIMPTEQDKAKAEVAATEEKQAAANLEKAELRKTIVTEWQALLDAAEPCDKANTIVGNIIDAMSEGTGSVYEAYASAERGVEACRIAHASIRDLDVPDGVDEKLRDDLSVSLKTCGDAYLLRQMSLDSAKDVFNGDMRPSAVNSFREQAEGAQSGVLACVAGYMSAALDAGVDLNDMKTEV